MHHFGKSNRDFAASLDKSGELNAESALPLAFHRKVEPKSSLRVESSDLQRLQGRYLLQSVPPLDSSQPDAPHEIMKPEKLH